MRSLADGESHFLFGVIDLYQTRVTTKMTVAMERLAVIAAITLPVTALASIYGMNVIVNDSTQVAQLVLGAGPDGLHQRAAPSMDEEAGLVVRIPLRPSAEQHLTVLVEGGETLSDPAVVPGAETVRHVGLAAVGPRDVVVGVAHAGWRVAAHG